MDDLTGFGDLDLCQEIVNNAHAAVGALWVQLTAYHPDIGDIRCVASSRFESGGSADPSPDLQHLRDQYEAWADWANARQNHLWDRVYRLARPVQASVLAISEPAAAADSGAIGVVYCSPLVVGGAVFGALSFYRRRRFTPRLKTIAEAFVRQTVLTLENRNLLGRLEQQLGLLSQSHERTVQAEERVRQEVAERLHGQLQTRLLWMESRLQTVFQALPKESPHHPVLAEVSQTLAHIRQHEVRRLSHRLHPAIIAIGLVPALKTLARDFPTMAVTIDSDAEFCALERQDRRKPEPSIRLACYRIIEEALQNAHRHGKATQTEIRIQVLDHRILSCTVRDDGQGFDSSARREGLGFGSIDGRVKNLSGEWSVISAPGQGTTVSVCLPLFGRED